MESLFVKLLFTSTFICFTLSDVQPPEINDQFNTGKPNTTHINLTEITKEPFNFTNNITTTENNKTQIEVKDKQNNHRKYLNLEKVVASVDMRPNFITIMYETLTKPIAKFISSPKVSFVLRNIGTCVVNGVMEIIAFYFPAPFIPLIASAAGMVIPFEPVVMLKEKMPVTSYRRAFRKAMNSFMNTFDGYKLDNYEEDPYMTRRFNRRFMNDISEEKKKENKDRP